MVIDERTVNIGKRQPGQLGDCIVGVDVAQGDPVDQLSQGGLVHSRMLRRSAHPPDAHTRLSNLYPVRKGQGRTLRPMVQRVGFFGPVGTFTQQALRTQPDLAASEQVPFRTVPDILDAVEDGTVDLGFVPIENSIEGMVNFTQDALAFDHDLLIVREVVIDIEHCLLARPGTTLADVTTLLSIPVATAQCHHYLREHLPEATIRAANSTADAAKTVSESDDPGIAALSPRVASEVYGLEIIASDIADHPDNQTRFLLVGRGHVPVPTGHDKTALVVYQRADEPGSLISILQEFAARRINLSNLFSRPTKDGGLGDYCFIMYADGHIADELLADTLRSLHAKHAAVKFMGSYPATGEDGDAVRAESGGRWADADAWLADIRGQID